MKHHKCNMCYLIQDCLKIVVLCSPRRLDKALVTGVTHEDDNGADTGPYPVSLGVPHGTEMRSGWETSMSSTYEEGTLDVPLSAAETEGARRRLVSHS